MACVHYLLVQSDFYTYVFALRLWSDEDMVVEDNGVGLFPASDPL